MFLSNKARRGKLRAMNNYEFCVAYAVSNLPKGGKMLDYGCGDGTIIKLARANGLEAYGCDVFYAGGDYSKIIPEDAFADSIFRMKDGRIPFGENTFDLVTNNQVLEHVDNLDHVVSEIARVLKPGGLVLSLFPDSGVWREGHCGVPFLHWFPKQSRFRVTYAYAARLIGIGYFKNGKRPRQWAEDFCQWLDDWTYYRSYAEINRTFARHLSHPHHLEAEWMNARLGKKARLLPSWVKIIIAKKYGHLTFECKKPLPSSALDAGRVGKLSLSAVTTK